MIKDSKAVQSVIRVIFAPWWATSEPVGEFLNAHASTGSTQVADTDDLTMSWADRKLAEHLFVSITVRLHKSLAHIEAGRRRYIAYRMTCATSALFLPA